MPIQNITTPDGPAYRWGNKGKECNYTEGDKTSEKEAHDKAATQGRAIEASKHSHDRDK